MNKKCVAFVPIKLNSQRLPGKMLLPLQDKKLCQHIFDTLIEVKKDFDIDIYCFCSDEEIIQYLPLDVHFLKRDNISKTQNIRKNINDIFV